MPYRDIEKSREAKRRHYRENKERYDEVRDRLRSKPGYRDGEYARKRQKAKETPKIVVSSPKSPSKAPKSLPRQPKPVTQKSVANSPKPPRQSLSNMIILKETQLSRELAEIQRKLKQEAMARMANLNKE